MTPILRTLTTTGLFGIALALAGCDRADQQGARNATGQATTSVEQTVKEAGKDIARAGAKVGDKIDDAMITSSVKAELAKHPDLSALRINVDTAAGRVALKGTAPTTAARQQATTLAQNVKGVVSVDNQLTVQQ